MGWMTCSSNSSRGKRFFFSPKPTNYFGAHPASYSMGNGAVYQRQSSQGMK